jgi:hypothetical protein
MESFIMKLAENNNKYIGVIYGVIIALALIAYFWLAWLVGFLHIPEMRALNLVIHVAGIYFALKQYRKTHDGSLNYFRAMSVGFTASTLGTIIFVIVLFITFQIDRELYNNIIKNEPMGRYLTVYMACFAVATEGVLSGSVATYLLMNYMHTDKV